LGGAIFKHFYFSILTPISLWETLCIDPQDIDGIDEALRKGRKVLMILRGMDDIKKQKMAIFKSALMPL
jgi:hypothetical protein